MTRRALTHTYPEYAPPWGDSMAPEDEWMETWTGAMRIVRNPKRARTLRRRGVPLMRISEGWAWFVVL